jgi:hypothetical protein
MKSFDAQIAGLEAQHARRKSIFRGRSFPSAARYRGRLVEAWTAADVASNACSRVAEFRSSSSTAEAVLAPAAGES